MDLLKEQSKQRNRIALQIEFIVFAYVLIAALVACLREYRIGSAIQIITPVISIIANGIFYKRHKESDLFMKFALINYAVLYGIVLLTGDLFETYIYIIPNIVLTIMFMNKRYIIGGSIYILVINVLDLIQQIYSVGLTGTQGEGIFIRFVILILVMYASVVVTEKLRSFQEQELALIEEKANKQQELAKANTELASELVVHFQHSTKEVEDLNQAIETNYTSISDIASSCESTAEAIQKQTEMTYNINENVKNAGERVKVVLENSEKGQQMIIKGIELIDDLKAHAETVKETSDSTKTAVNNLLRQISKVEDITDAILNISGQTNLLALNASIEAARAGEAGKGFAVVADEIRKLSDETKEATAQITEIINTLTVDANIATESMDKSVDSVKEQNTLMDVASKEFIGIGSTMKTLHSSIDQMDEVFENIVKSTEEISQNISQLSATTEEVAASSQSGIKNSEASMESLKQVNELLQKIYQVTTKLTQGI